VFPDAAGAPVIAITGVTRETVANMVIGALERPRRAVYPTRWRVVVELVMLVNHFFPGVIDRAVRSSVVKMWQTHQEHDLEADAAGGVRERVALSKR
jgi:hypothetical protein